MTVAELYWWLSTRAVGNVLFVEVITDVVLSRTLRQAVSESSMVLQEGVYHKLSCVRQGTVP